MNKPAASKTVRAMTLLLPLWCAACAATLQPSTGVICPPPPEIPALPPSLSKPPPPASYLEAAQKRIESWQQELTGSATR